MVDFSAVPWTAGSLLGNDGPGSDIFMDINMDVNVDARDVF